MNVPVAVASCSQLAADAGATVAGRGGNAVDTAIAAALASMNTEPGVCGLGGGGFVTVWPPDGPPVVIDGYAAAPGLGLPEDRLGTGGVEVFVHYGGGVRTVVGPGSVATPGGVAALGEASERFGGLPWTELFGPVIEAAENGFPLPGACHHYLEASADCVFRQDRDGWDCLHDANGHLKPPGATIRVPHLADSLRRVARRGAREFYSGELGHRIADHVQARGGTLTRQDLADYRAKLRQPLVTPVNRWQVATNPSPALGGVILTTMLTLLAGEYPSLPSDPVARQIAVQKLVLGYRHRQAGDSRTVERDMRRLMAGVDRRNLQFIGSPSTVQTSTVDGSGLGLLHHHVHRLWLRAHADGHRHLVEQLPRRTRTDSPGARRARPGRAVALQHGADHRPRRTGRHARHRFAGRGPHHHRASAGPGPTLAAGQVTRRIHRRAENSSGIRG